ncbi:hypothetical protein NEMBOFW57_008844 [Staphylotrichum longicolle]|uniref:Uncharacterized protein n=1 Tax=Staphylotrichum longicolle TaxID=669026 RepID=A0AAD4HZ94_9PEZI|nr:hypothetical protein NEMBOFW57_008844 [Staphylotrichum longicolle]
MAPLIPRMDVFEFPNFLRAYFQAALTAAWTTHIPLLQTSSPASRVAHLLRTHLPSLPSYVFIDFCAGGGGPTPAIERHLNNPSHRVVSPQEEKKAGSGEPPLQFVLTDLHPHTDLWAQAAAQSRNISYVREPVDASDAPRALVDGYRSKGKKVFRLFNLAFHHFGDGLARRILRDTVEGGGNGFGIFELQDRGLAGFLSCCLFGVGTLIMAPYYAVLWGAPMALFFTYVVPILPVVLVFDGWMSCLRTRTADEVEALLRTCGAEEKEIAKWEIKSGSEPFMWPVGNVNWVICVKK